MLMYKVMRTKSDGMLYSINVNRRKPYNIDEWVTAEYILTKHYHDKKGFYGFEKPDVQNTRTICGAANVASGSSVRSLIM